MQVGARSYDPLAGQFVSLDPQFNTEDPHSWNGYAYSNNNPIDFSDPTGLVLDDVANGSVSQTTLDIITGKRPGECYKCGDAEGNGNVTHSDLYNLSRVRHNRAAWHATLEAQQQQHQYEAAERNQRREAAEHQRMIDASDYTMGDLVPENLLFAPKFINNLPWSRGYFETVHAQPIGDGDRLKEHRCRELPRPGVYLDLHGTRSTSPPSRAAPTCLVATAPSMTL